jgi:glycosyltransferase involved in cell wall biosynthesis
MALLKDRGVALELWLAGQGPLQGSLQAQVARLGVGDRVRFLGQVPHDELMRRYASGDVHAVVLPSVDLGGGECEGIPVSLVEAMAHGIPVVSTSTGAIPELLENGAGVLVPERDPQALALALESLVRDGALWERYSRDGRERATSQYDVRVTAGRLVELFAGRANGRNGLYGQNGRSTG